MTSTAHGERGKQEKIFGTDGVRGKANHYPMTVETALALGRAAGLLFRKHDGKHRVVVGKDTRLSCYMFENALIAGLCSMGIDTLMVGPFPTPGISFITRAYRADAGIMISASHNPYYDNGIKFFSSEGFKLPDSVEEEIEKIIEQKNYLHSLPLNENIGRNTRVHDADGRYIEYVKATFPRQKSLRNLKVALDCSNGAAYKVAPLVLQELDAQVFVYGTTPNGLNINLDCGSLHPEMVQKGVIDHHADVGIALDGDGDRVIMVDELAQIIDGDTILAICARDMHQKGVLLDGKVVTTIMANFGLTEALTKLGIQVFSSKVGDRYVIQEMLKQGAVLGGEQSGHIIFLEHNTTGDGLVSALQVLRIMVETGQSLSELASFIKRAPQCIVNVVVKSKPALESVELVQSAIKKAEELLKDKGRVLVRYSGTEMLCRVMVEGMNKKQVEMLSLVVAEAVRREIGV